MVIMVVPKPSALWTQDPERITIITYRIAKTDILYSLERMHLVFKEKLFGLL